MYIRRVYLSGGGFAAGQTALNKIKRGGSTMNQDNQKTKNTHKPRNTKSAQRKKATETILPTVEEAKLSLPPHLELLPSDTDETPTLIDREHYGTTLKVWRQGQFGLLDSRQNGFCGFLPLCGFGVSGFVGVFSFLVVLIHSTSS